MIEFHEIRRIKVDHKTSPLDEWDTEADYVECLTCGKRFDNYWEAEQHQKEAMPENMHQCEVTTGQPPLYQIAVSGVNLPNGKREFPQSCHAAQCRTCGWFSDPTYSRAMAAAWAIKHMEEEG